MTHRNLAAAAAAIGALTIWALASSPAALAADPPPTSQPPAPAKPASPAKAHTPLGHNRPGGRPPGGGPKPGGPGLPDCSSNPPNPKCPGGDPH